MITKYSNLNISYLNSITSALHATNAEFCAISLACKLQMPTINFIITRSIMDALICYD